MPETQKEGTPENGASPLFVDIHLGNVLGDFLNEQPHVFRTVRAAALPVCGAVDDTLFVKHINRIGECGRVLRLVFDIQIVQDTLGIRHTERFLLRDGVEVQRVSAVNKKALDDDRRGLDLPQESEIIGCACGVLPRLDAATVLPDLFPIARK